MSEARQAKRTRPWPAGDVTEAKSKAICHGCRDDFYNARGGCWCYEKAEVVTRYKIELVDASDALGRLREGHDARLSPCAWEVRDAQGIAGDRWVQGGLPVMAALVDSRL